MERGAIDRVADSIESLEAAGKHFLELFEFLSQENVGVGVDAEDESDFGLLLRVVEDSADELVRGCDASAAGDEGDVRVFVECPGISLQRTCEGERLTRGHGMEVRACFAVGISLDQELNETGLIWRMSEFELLRAMIGQEIVPRSLTGV